MDVDAIVNAFKAKTFVIEAGENKRMKINSEDSNRALKSLWWQALYSVQMLGTLNDAFLGYGGIDLHGLLGIANHFLNDGTRDGNGCWTRALRLLSRDVSFLPTMEQPFVVEIREADSSYVHSSMMASMRAGFEDLDYFESARDGLKELGLLREPEPLFVSTQQEEADEVFSEDSGDGEGSTPPSSPTPPTPQTPTSPAAPEEPSVYSLETLIQLALSVIDRTTQTLHIAEARKQLTERHHSPFLHAHDLIFENHHEGVESSVIKSPFTLYYKPAYSFGHEVWEYISYANRNGDVAAAYRTLVLKAVLFVAEETTKASPAGAAERTTSVFVDSRTDAVLDLVVRVHAAILEIGSDLTQATAVERFAKLQSFKEDHETLLADLEAQLQKFQLLKAGLVPRGWTTNGSPLVDLLVAVANVGMRLGIARYGAGAGDMSGAYLQGDLAAFPGFQFDQAQGGAGPL